MKNPSQSFEASVERLEQIVRQLEDGSIPLSDALRLFQEGTALATHCSTLLDQAELEIVKLTRGPDGTAAEGVFTDDDAD